MRSQPWRAGQHQQKRRVGTHLLTGVEQRSTHLQVERVRLVDQRRQRFPAAPGGQLLPQVAHAPGRRRPLDRAHRCHAQFAGQQLRYPGGRCQNLDQRLPGRNVVRGQFYHVNVRYVIAAGALKPVEQHRLAGAARAGQDDVVRWSPAAEQVAYAPLQHRLLPLAAGEGRRRGAVAGSEQALPRVLHVGQPNVYQISASAPTASRVFPGCYSLVTGEFRAAASAQLTDPAASARQTTSQGRGRRAARSLLPWTIAKMYRCEIPAVRGGRVDDSADELPGIEGRVPCNMVSYISQVDSGALRPANSHCPAVPP